MVKKMASDEDGQPIESDLKAVPQKRLTSMIHELNLMVARLFNRQMREFDLTRTQWQVLYWLNHDDGQSQTNLANTLLMAKPPLGRIVDRLEEQGWVVRKDDPKDRRVKLVYLTEKFTPLREPLDGVVDDLCELAMADISTRDRQKLNELLKRIHANLSVAINVAQIDAPGR